MNNQNCKYPFSILFVEDEPQILERYSNYLERFFDCVYQAQTISSAFEKYKKLSPDILIVDINLPDGTGIDFLKKIRENDIKTKAIILTAHNSKNYILESTELKLTKYLIKPVSRESLLESLESAIDELRKYQITNKRILNLQEGYFWDFQKSEPFNSFQTINLNPSEKKLCKLFFNNINKVFTYDDITFELWDGFEEDKTNAIKLIIKALRKKHQKI